MRRRLVIAVFASAVLAAAIVGAASLRRRSAPRAKPPAPAGGAVEEPIVDAATIDEETDGGFLAGDGRRYPVRTFRVSLEKSVAKIADVAMSTALDEVLDRAHAELVVNAGFFDPKGRPLGLARTDGTTLSPLLKNLSGGVVTVEGDIARLWEAESFTLPESAKFAVQCRPRLVVGGKPNVKSDDGKRSERTALCLRDGGKTLDVFVIHAKDVGEPTGPSLFALGRFLARHGCQDALNLDGGPSTGVAYREDGATKLLAPRAGVRHAIAFVAK